MRIGVMILNFRGHVTLWSIGHDSQ